MGDSPRRGAAFELQTRVRFHQADPAGVLFFGRIFELVHDAYEELIRSAFIPFDAYFLTRDYLVPIVHAEADYRRPIRVGEAVTVRLEIERIGRSSLGYRFAVRGPDDELCVQGEVIHAFVDAKTFATIDIPSRVRQQLNQLVQVGPGAAQRTDNDGR